MVLRPVHVWFLHSPLQPPGPSSLQSSAISRQQRVLSAKVTSGLVLVLVPSYFGPFGGGSAHVVERSGLEVLQAITFIFNKKKTKPRAHERLS